MKARPNSHGAPRTACNAALIRVQLRDNSITLLSRLPGSRGSFGISVWPSVRQTNWGIEVKLGLVAFSVLFFVAGSLRAQSDRASITGTVRDPSGAVISGVLVTATNLGTSLRETAVTNEQGLYRLQDLPIGEYTVAASKQEFEDYQRTGIHLSIRQETEINVVLKVGTSLATVIVTGDAPQLQTETSAISTNLTNAAITQLPLNVQGGRTLSAFMFPSVPGVEGVGATPADKDFTSHIDGSLSETKEVMIDGTSGVSQIGGYLIEPTPPTE